MPTPAYRRFQQAMRNALTPTGPSLSQIRPTDRLLAMLQARQPMRPPISTSGERLPDSLQQSPTGATSTSAPRAGNALQRIANVFGGGPGLTRAGLAMLSGRGHDRPTIGAALLGAAQQEDARRLLAEDERKRQEQEDSVDAALRNVEGLSGPNLDAVLASPPHVKLNVLSHVISKGLTPADSPYKVVGGSLLRLEPGKDPVVVYEQPQAAKTTTVSPGNTVLGPNGELIYRAPYSPSQLRAGQSSSGGATIGGFSVKDLDAELEGF